MVGVVLYVAVLFRFCLCLCLGLLVCWLVCFVGIGLVSLLVGCIGYYCLACFLCYYMIVVVSCVGFWLVSLWYVCYLVLRWGCWC